MVLIGALFSLQPLVATMATLLTLDSAHAREARSLECEDALDTSRPHILPQDVRVFQEIAIKRNLEIVVMAPNPASLRYRSLPGYAAKPAELKGCKSASAGPIEGLVHCPETAFKSHADWVTNKSYLLEQGYEVLGPEQGYLVRRIDDGKYFFSDYDLFSVRDARTRRPAYSEALRAEMNHLLGRNLVRHGPLEDYAQRTDVAIKLPMLIVTPDARPKPVESRPQLEREFRARGLPLW